MLGLSAEFERSIIVERVRAGLSPHGPPLTQHDRIPTDCDD
jgi:hypothetical protein